MKLSGFFVLLTVFISTTLHAATITVTSNAWKSDTACTLTDAITAANTDSTVGACSAGNGADVIEIGSATYMLDGVAFIDLNFYERTYSLGENAGDTYYFPLLTALPLIESDLEIVGNGAVITINENVGSSIAYAEPTDSSSGRTGYNLLSVARGAHLKGSGFSLLGVVSGDYSISDGLYINNASVELEQVTLKKLGKSVRMENAAHLTLDAADVSENTYFALELNGGSHVELRNSVVQRNAYYALSSIASSINIINSKITENYTHAIRAEQSVITIDSSVVSKNNGDAIYARYIANKGSHLTIRNSQIAYNRNRGISVDSYLSSLLLDNSVIVANGGVGVNAGPDTVISNSAIANNSGRGVVVGGVLNYPNDSEGAKIINTSILSNQGGGILAGDGTSIIGSTIAGNRGPSGYNATQAAHYPLFVYGSGISYGAYGQVEPQRKLYMVNTVVAENSSDSSIPQCAARFETDSANNFIQDGSCHGAFSGNSPLSDQVTTSNGMIYRPMSPASQAATSGNIDLCLDYPLDQLGVERLTDGVCALGAVEPVASDSGEQAGNNDVRTVTLKFDDIASGTYQSLSISGFTLSSEKGLGLQVLNRDGKQVVSRKAGDNMVLERTDESTFDLIRFNAKGRLPSSASSGFLRATFENGLVELASLIYDQNQWIDLTGPVYWKDLIKLSFRDSYGQELISSISISIVNTTGGNDNGGDGSGDGDNSSGGGSSGNAATVDFQVLPASDYQTIETGGFSFSPVWANSLAVLSQDGTQVLSPAWGDHLLLQASDGSSFDLAQFDVKGRWPGISSQVTLTATFRDGTQQTTTVDYSNTRWLTKILGWKNLVQVVFTTNNGRAMFNNFHFSPDGSLVDPGSNGTDTKTVITFNSLVAGDFAAVSTEGYRFIPNIRKQLVILDYSGDKLLSPFWSEEMKMSRVDGTAFNLESLEIQGYWWLVNGTLTITGVKVDGQRLTESVPYNGHTINSVTVNWQDLEEVVFSTPDGRVMIDYVTTTQ